MTQFIDMRESHATAIIPREPTLSRRVAAAVVRMAHHFRSDILFTVDTIHIDAKSTLMAFTLLEALKGHVIELTARGPDSAAAVQNLLKLFEGKL